jgi:hypothetical protein
LIVFFFAKATAMSDIIISAASMVVAGYSGRTVVPMISTVCTL